MVDSSFPWDLRRRVVSVKILYLHGLGSGPNAYKASLLAQRGHDVSTPRLGDEDFEQSLIEASRALREFKPEVIVGSSRGGSVAMNLDQCTIPLVLIAPAWKRWGNADRLKPAATVLHSPSDEVVPIQWSRELIRQSGLPETSLIEIGSSHAMTDQAALAALFDAVQSAAEDR